MFPLGGVVVRVAKDKGFRGYTVFLGRWCFLEWPVFLTEIGSGRRVFHVAFGVWRCFLCMIGVPRPFFG